MFFHAWALALDKYAAVWVCKVQKHALYTHTSYRRIYDPCLEEHCFLIYCKFVNDLSGSDDSEPAIVLNWCTACGMGFYFLSNHFYCGA